MVFVRAIQCTHDVDSANPSCTCDFSFPSGYRSSLKLQQGDIHSSLSSQWFQFLHFHIPPFCLIRRVLLRSQCIHLHYSSTFMTNGELLRLLFICSCDPLFSRLVSLLQPWFTLLISLHGYKKNLHECQIVLNRSQRTGQRYTHLHFFHRMSEPVSAFQCRGYCSLKPLKKSYNRFVL